MVRRTVLPLLRQRLRQFPAVALLGARQTGKTTLARSLSGHYFDLEQEADRLRLDLEWEQVIASRELVVLDEAQAWPALFPRLRGAIDGDRARNRRFLLLGSVSPALVRNVSESLAGRLSLLELTPLLATELGATRADPLWLQGGYPDGGVLTRGRFPGWQSDYLTLLAQRDLPGWGLPATAPTTLRLFKMLAAAHGSVWNASDIARSLGLSYHTVNSYLDYLEGAFLVRRLPPFHRKIGKRLVKSPKVYWRDSGLLHALLGVSTRDGLLAQPWVGASWEGWVIEQVLAHLASRGTPAESFFFRTADGIEIDLVLEFGGKRWAIEVKLTSSASQGEIERLERAADLIDADVRCLVSRTARPARGDRRMSTNLRGLLDALS